MPTSWLVKGKRFIIISDILSMKKNWRFYLDTETTPLIGIGITTTPNRTLLDHTLEQWRRWLPAGAKLVVHEDIYYDGISVAKNKLLEQLAECDHIFLADDDTYPIVEDWWKPYVESPEPHLQYNFTNGPDHWGLTKVSGWEGHNSYDRSRGCMLYVERRVLEIVGGMHNVFGRHGREHEDWSERIHKAGLTKHPFQSVDGKHFYCADEDQTGVSSVDFSANKGWKHVDSSTLPLYAEYKSYAVPMLVARRNDGGHRDRLWRFLKRHYYLIPRVVEGYHKDGPFNRSLALNIASTLAGNWHVAVFIDSDAYIDPERLNEAIRLAVDTQQMVIPFDKVVELNEWTTDEILTSGKLLYSPEQDQIEKVRDTPVTTQSLFVVVPRNLYEQVGGFDEQFVGWGGEDNAFYRSAEIIGGEVLRMPGNVYHLWHPQASRAHQPQNGFRYRMYQVAHTKADLDQLRRLS